MSFAQFVGPYDDIMSPVCMRMLLVHNETPFGQATLQALKQSEVLRHLTALQELHAIYCDADWRSDISRNCRATTNISIYSAPVLTVILSNIVQVSPIQMSPRSFPLLLLMLLLHGTASYSHEGDQTSPDDKTQAGHCQIDPGWITSELIVDECVK